MSDSNNMDIGNAEGTCKAMLRMVADIDVNDEGVTEDMVTKVLEKITDLAKVLNAAMSLEKELAACGRSADEIEGLSKGETTGRTSR